MKKVLSILLMLFALLPLGLTVEAAAAEPVLTPRYPTAAFEGAVEYCIYFTMTNGENLNLEDIGLITFEEEPENGTVENADDVIPGAVYNQSMGMYMVHTNGIPAKNLGDELYFKVYARLSDGSYVYSVTRNYSIVTYAHSMLSNPYEDPELQELVRTMLHYGAAAQNYFDYRTDTLVNRGIETQGHIYTDHWTLVTPPSFTAPGLEQRVCTICGGAAQTRELPQLTLSGLTVTTQPKKTLYYTGEAFDPAGMVVTGILSDGSSLPITDYTLDKEVLTATDTAVTVSYMGKTVAVSVTVSPYEKYSVSDLSQLADGTTAAVEGYYVGVAEEGPSADQELLLKDLTTDDVIAVRNLPYGTFPDYGYRCGDRVCFLATLETDGTVNTRTKRYLDFSAENGDQSSTVISSGNSVSYELDNVITVTDWEQMQTLFSIGAIPDYSYVRLEGPIYFNRYSGSDGVDVSRIHMNAAATGVSGIRSDGSRTVCFRDNVNAANLGDDWKQLFFEEEPATGTYPGTRVNGSVTALYTGGNNYYYQLTILDESWVDLEQYNNLEALTTTANAYYLQGTQIQYDQNNRRRNLGVKPEMATDETTVYLDCSSYVNAVYQSAFGVNVMDNDEVPSTAKFDAYCAEAAGSDVIGRWVNADYTTAAQISKVLSQVRGQLQVGDLLVYRHGTPDDMGGHVYVYMGDDLFLHCTGSSYSLGSTPEESRDKATADEKNNGAIAQIHADEIFTNTDSKRYLFKATASDTVYSFGLIRPLVRGLTPTQEAKSRLRLRGLDLQLQADVFQYQGLRNGQTLTCTLTMTNDADSRLSAVPVAISLPPQLTLVSSEKMTLTDNVLSWAGNINAGATVTLSFTLQVSGTPGDSVELTGNVDGLALNTLIYTLDGLTDAQRQAVANRATGAVGTVYADPLDLAGTALGTTVDATAIAGLTAKQVLSQLIDTANDTCRTDAALSPLVIPDLYGGMDIKDGYITDCTRTRLVEEGYLETGDLFVGEYDGIYQVMIYLGNGKLVKVSSDDGICTLVTSTGDEYSGTNVFTTFIAYDRYVLLRFPQAG